MRKKIWKQIAAITLSLATVLCTSTQAFASGPASSEPSSRMEFVSKSIETGKVESYEIARAIPRSGEMVQSSFSGTEPEERKIIGNDDRIHVTSTTSFPYRAIAYIESYWPNGDTTIGTAWLFASNAAATAGHCVYDSSRGGWADGVTIWPGYNEGQKPYGSAYATYLHTSSNYTSSEDRNYDYGILELNTDIGTNVGYFGYRYQADSYTGTNITVAGYPGQSLQGQLWRMSGQVTSCTSNRLEYQIDTTGGQSGSPIYLYDSAHGYVSVGIHTAGYTSLDYNLGTRITQFMYDWFGQFR